MRSCLYGGVGQYEDFCGDAKFHGVAWDGFPGERDTHCKPKGVTKLNKTVALVRTKPLMYFS